MKKVLLSVLAVVAVVALAITGTIAYLQYDDSAVNVMTLGNVKIEQIEQERDANGNLVAFTPAKPAYPAVGPVAWAAQGVNVNGTEYKVFTPELKNVVDKIVTVKNTGISDAYVRTVLMIETPDYDPNNWVHINTNADNIDWSNWVLVEIDGVKYCAIVATYNEALVPGEISAPSLLQVFLDSEADNEYCAAFGDAWEIFVLSQAVQTKGFDNAATALDTAFGAINADNVKTWFVDEEVPVVADTAEELTAALTAGKDVILTDDVALDANDQILVSGGVLNGNGKTLDATASRINGMECVLDTRGGVIQNLTIVGPNARALGSGSNNVVAFTEDLYIDNVTVDYTYYAINGSINSGHSVYVTNSNINGWVSYAGLELLSFKNTTLAKGNTTCQYGIGYLVVYGNTLIEDCTLDTFYFGVNSGALGYAQAAKVAGTPFTLTINNTYCNTTSGLVKVTVDNYRDLLTDGNDARDFGRLIDNVDIIIDGVKAN